MDSALRELCARQVPGDTHRNLQVEAHYSKQTFKHILAPVWLMSYVYRGRPYQVVVNAVSGRVAGERPWSWIKVTLLVLVIVIALIVVNALNN